MCPGHGYIGAVESTERAQQYVQASLDQLNAEIAAKGLDVKKVSVQLGIDYNTFRRYMNGERPLPMHTFWQTLSELGIDEGTFVRRVRERLLAD